MQANHPALPLQKNPLPLYSLFIADAISLVGNVLALVAIPWFVLQTTHSAAKTGLTGFFNILPVVLAGFFGGALVDRLGYRRTSVIADLASGVTVLLIPLLHFTVGLQFWQLAALVFLGALLDSPGSTARASLLPDLAAQAGMPVERAAALHHIIERGARMLGAPLAGVLIAVMGAAGVLWLDALSFFVSAVIVALTVTGARPSAPASRAGGGYARELREGLRFVYEDRLIFSIVITVLVTNFLDAAYSSVVLPVYVNTVFGKALNLGLIIAANGAGAVTGAAVYAWLGPRLPRHATFVLMFTLTGLRFWLLALYPPFPVVLAGIFFVSLGAGPLSPIVSTVEFRRIPADMRGRVLGAIQAAAWMAMPLGTLLGGYLVEGIGVRPVLVGLGTLYLLTTLSMAFIPAMRQMDELTPSSAPETP